MPDDVICHILSFLSTRISAQTSILSRRWRFLWAHVPVLDFKTSLSGIVNGVMSLHKEPNIHTFRLAYLDLDFTSHDLETWIATVIVRNVRNLSLSFMMSLSLPRCLFTCKTLVRLTLREVTLTDTYAVYLPSLKKLDLYGLMFESDKSLSHLLSGCPVLEDLSLLMPLLDIFVCLCITSPTLERLKYDSGFNYRDKANFGLMLNTPALRYLNIYDGILVYFSAGVLTSLIEADIDLHCSHLYGCEELDSSSMIDFIGGLYNVNSLKLFTPVMVEEVTVVFDFPRPGFTMKFHNLTKLDLFGDLRFLLPKFLENADNLEVLTIHIIDENLKCWIEPEQVPTCLLSHLRTIRIVEFGCTREQEFDMVSYILRNGKVLKRMEIYACVDLETADEALERISLFERGSEACQLSLQTYV
ncbi:F-box/FBD/LRR-repeat protein at1g16930 [Phtheirospermum japonicum]|uniref:F-box/FBD/LRR-repeat protein at1g16930 n=1 Tax=Phtheirospermum japonicum TaxID=374723 RepID=A0A830D031_9LAMI|nr:F-box/FBD/LRR-repeat protein at1g16930 [Phtheirospermum japonicum]